MAKRKNTTTTPAEDVAEVMATVATIESVAIDTTTTDTVEVVTETLSDDTRAEVTALGLELSEAKAITESVWWRIGWLMLREIQQYGVGAEEWIRREVLAALNASPAFHGVKATTIATQVSASLTTAIVFPSAESRLTTATKVVADDGTESFVLAPWSSHYEVAKDVKACPAPDRVAYLDSIRAAAGGLAEVTKPKALELAAAAGVPNAVTKVAEVKANREAKRLQREQNRTGGNAPEASGAGVVESNGTTANVQAMAAAALESPPAVVAAIGGLGLVDVCKAVSQGIHTLFVAEGDLPESMVPGLESDLARLATMLGYKVIPA